MNVEGVLAIWNEEYESYCIMSRRLVSILLLSFESLKYVKFVLLLTMCIVYDLVWLWYDSIEFLSLESVESVLVSFEDKRRPSGGECKNPKN